MTLPKGLELLAGEARKYRTFEEFETAFLGQIKHGEYYHVTDNPKFTIDPMKGPRDMSSMADHGGIAPGKLMITSDLDAWVDQYPDRLYVAIINMGNVPAGLYWQVKRGFGNEFWVEDPRGAKVISVLPRVKAVAHARYYHSLMPSSREELREFYKMVKGK